jgi:hypothetical protein
MVMTLQLTNIGGNGAGAPPPGTQKTAGALGRGLQFTTAFVLLFQFLVCVFPIFGGWLADAVFGRYKVVTIGVWISAAAHILMVISAIPSLLKAEVATAPFMISFFMLAFGTGMLPFLQRCLQLLTDFRSLQAEYRSDYR